MENRQESAEKTAIIPIIKDVFSNCLTLPSPCSKSQNKHPQHHPRREGMAFYDGGRIGRVTTFLLILQFRLEKEILTEI
ncbi:MAG: hypothetical protein K2I61_08085 [Muribaculaceae bacterium]|nr:hypothetical protein [Muribaculaceae bacterium]